MAVTSVANGNQLAVISTEHSLFTSSAAGVYVFATTCPAAFTGTDVVELRIYSVINGATEVLAYYAVYTGMSSSASAKYSVPVPTATAGDTLRFTLKQTAGTGRTFPYRISTIG